MRNDATGKALAAFSPLGASLVLLPLRAQVHAENASLVLVVVVLAVAVARGRTPGVIAALSAAVCFDFFFTRPFYSLNIVAVDDVEATAVLLIVGLTVGGIVTRSRRLALEASESRAVAHYLQASALLVAGSEPPGHLIRAVQRELVEILGVKSARFESTPLIGDLPALRHGRVIIPSAPDSFPIDASQGNLAEVRVYGHAKLFGRFVIEVPMHSSGVTISAQQRALALALTDQLGAALADRE